VAIAVNIRAWADAPVGIDPFDVVSVNAAERIFEFDEPNATLLMLDGVCLASREIPRLADSRDIAPQRFVLQILIEGADDDLYDVLAIFEMFG